MTAVDGTGRARSATISPTPASHAHDPLPPVQHLRPDVPAAVGALLNRLLAKDPADRPSAAEVAAALDPFASVADSAGVIDFSQPPPSLGPVSRGELSGLLAVTARPETVSLWAEIVTDDDAEAEEEAAEQDTISGSRGDQTPLMTARKRKKRKPARTAPTNRRRLIVNAAVATGVLAALGIVLILLKLALK